MIHWNNPTKILNTFRSQAMFVYCAMDDSSRIHLNISLGISSRAFQHSVALLQTITDNIGDLRSISDIIGSSTMVLMPCVYYTCIRLVVELLMALGYVTRQIFIFVWILLKNIN